MSNDIESYDSDKEAFFRELETLRPDLLYSDAWKPSQKAQAVEMLRPNKVKLNMLSAIPMECKGSDCPFAPSCPLYKEDLHPVGEKCPIEQTFVVQLFNDYVEELEVDVDRLVEVSIVRDLVDQEVQQLRKSWTLSQEHFIQENVVGIDDNGSVITQKQLHHAVDYEDRILRRKEKLRNALLATRESKLKAGQSKTDSATVIANIMQEIRKIDRAKEKALMKQLGYHEDEYIMEAEAEIELKSGE